MVCSTSWPGSYYIVRLVSNSQRFVCFCFLNSSIKHRQISEFETNLLYRVRTRTAGTMQRNSVRVSTFCLLSWFCIVQCWVTSLMSSPPVQCPVLGKTVDVFSTLVTCLVPASTLKASHQGGSLLVRLRLIFLFSAAKVYAVFSNRILSLQSETRASGRSLCSGSLWDFPVQ